MKIGILTYHRVYNYGATLQAIATRLFLSKNGHQAYYIDYYPAYHRKSYRPFDLDGLRKRTFIKKVHYLYICCKHYTSKKKRIDKYRPFVEKHIVPYCKKSLNEQYDAIIYGSDQIWRKQSGLSQNFNPIYFGINDFQCKKHISYAASMGTVSLKEEDKEFLKNALHKFDAIGVREEDLYSVLKGLNLSHLQQTIDPTLLLESKEWDEVLRPKRIIKEPYVLYYNVRTSFSNRYIFDFCKQKKLKLVKVNSFGHPLGSTYNPDPEEFISLIKYADVVLTSSFHGLAFSIIYQKDFWASTSSNSGRLRNLMERLDMIERFIMPNSPIPIDTPPIKYPEVYTKLQEFKKKSETFLIDALFTSSNNQTDNY